MSTVAAPQAARSRLPIQFLQSTIGAKVGMAVTGVVWVGYLIVHVVANLLVFAGRDTLNGYAAALKSSPALLWGVRGLLLVTIVAHIVFALKLTARNRTARGVGYREQQFQQAKANGRFMAISGLALLAFVVYHLLHFTLGVTNPEQFALFDAQGRHDVYGMVLRGFRTPVIAVTYLVAMGLLAMHLSHAVTSMMNTIGLASEHHPFLRRLGPALAMFVVGGGVLIVVGVWLGLPPDPGAL